MHSVPRSPEPDYWEQLKDEHQRWGDLGGQERVQIRDSLVEDFGPICVYCERPCSSPTAGGNAPDEETIDHFKPRNHFPQLSFDWLNLVHSCYRCNQRKGNQWPGYQDELTNELLAAYYQDQYVPPSEYVSPNLIEGVMPARDYFEFDVTTGEILPGEELEATQWSMAVRTIRDIDLNDNGPDSPGENNLGHLWNRRKTQLNLLLGQISRISDHRARVSLFQQFSMPDKPFSGFIAAYYRQLTA